MEGGGGGGGKGKVRETMNTSRFLRHQLMKTAVVGKRDRGGEGRGASNWINEWMKRGRKLKSTCVCWARNASHLHIIKGRKQRGRANPNWRKEMKRTWTVTKHRGKTEKGEKDNGRRTTTTKEGRREEERNVYWIYTKVTWYGIRKRENTINLEFRAHVRWQ